MNEMNPGTGTWLVAMAVGMVFTIVLIALSISITVKRVLVWKHVVVWAKAGLAAAERREEVKWETRVELGMVKPVERMAGAGTQAPFMCYYCGHGDHHLCTGCKCSCNSYACDTDTKLKTYADEVELQFDKDHSKTHLPNRGLS